MEKPIDCLIIISIDHCVQTRYIILLMLQVCREMMALPLLPHEHIVAAFDLLAARVTATTPMLLGYSILHTRPSLMLYNNVLVEDIIQCTHLHFMNIFMYFYLSCT